jgi:hypothetical protein
MRKVLVIESNSKMEGLYFLNLTLYLNISPTMKQTAQFSYKVLDEEDDIKLIVTRERVGEEDTAQNILNYLEKNDRTIPVIIIGSVEKKELAEKVQYIKSGVELKPLLTTVASVLNITPAAMMRVKVPPFYPIPINYFFSLLTTNCDVYKIDFNEDGEEEHVLAFKAGSDIQDVKVKELISIGSSDLFVTDTDRLRFINHLTDETVQNISHKELTEGDRVLAGKAALESLSSLVTDVGINPQTISMAKASMKNLVMNSKESPKLGRLLKSLMSNKAGYLFQHTQVLTFVAIHIVQNMGWGNVKQNEEKMAFLALFHDIALKKDEYAQIRDKDDLTKSKLSKEEKELIKNHANLAASLVNKHPECPPDAETIIRQHHGHMSGTDIPEKFDFNISQLTALFMVAEEFADKLIEVPEGEKPNKAFIMAGVRKRFSNKKYLKIVDVLDKIVL